MFPEVLVDGSLNCFADDLCRKLPVRDDLAETTIDLLHKNRTALDAELEQRGYTQNHNKNDTVASLRSYRQNKKLMGSNIPGGVHPAARYLGAQQTWNAAANTEIGYRIMGMNQNWMRMQRLWFSKALARWRRLVFLVRIQSVALTGLEAVVPTEQALRMLDTKMYT